MLYDTIIIGGGASGLMAACALARRGLRVALLEKQSRVGRKLLSTGNGRCNLTNRNACASNYHGARNVAQAALRAWPPKKIEALFAELGVPTVADEAGRVYPMSGQAASVLDALRLYCDEHGVETLTGFRVVRLAQGGAPQSPSATAPHCGGEPNGNKGTFMIASPPQRGSTREAGDGAPRSPRGNSASPAMGGRCGDSLFGGATFEAIAEDGRRVAGKTALVATGGLAAPKLGASGDGYDLIRAFGHTLAPRFPAIAALKTAAEPIRGLKGIRAACEIKLLSGGDYLRTERGEVLFSDTGVSGIAAMQLCRAANEVLRARRPCAVRLNLAPDMDARTLLTARAAALPKRGMEDFLNGIVHKKLGQSLVRAAGLSLSQTAGELSSAQLNRLADALTGWTIPVTATLGFDQAQVTAGGASLGDFDARIMMSLRVPGLFAAGEVLDVDGDCGGFNLQWAWSSALMAVEGICNMTEDSYCP